MDGSQHIRRRSSIATRSSAEITSPKREIQQTEDASEPSAPPKTCRFSNHAAAMQLEGKLPSTDVEVMPPPPVPLADSDPVGRASRSTSNASRSANRLSLTLPVAPPSRDASRPSSTITSSFPATPVELASAPTPVDANDFIIAIAAQERRVLELREELERAEGELSKLKRQWAAQEAYQKRTGAGRNLETRRPLAPRQDDKAAEETAAKRRSTEIDKRKSLLQAQGAPKEHRRRVMRGGHTRTLSLLSPTKSDGGFSGHDAFGISRTPDVSTPSTGTPTGRPLASSALSKRASWQPAAYNPNQQGVKQMAEDFKLGLWSFVEDIRQATVGDEPISGHTQQQQGAAQETPARRQRPMSIAGDQDTIKASSAARGSKTALRAAFEAPSPVEGSSRTGTPTQERPIPKPKGKGKQFSWTPLSVDSFDDDDDWSNWESPTVLPTKSSRWSGSTVGGPDGVSSIPEGADEYETPLKKKSSRTSMVIDTTTNSTGRGDNTPPLVLSPGKLEEIFPNVVNKLSPSNIKRTANTLMDEWERSLTPPQKARNAHLVDLLEDTENRDIRL